KGSGHFVQPFSVKNSIDPELKNEIESIFNAPYTSNLQIHYSPSNEMLKDLYSILGTICNELDITITNVVEHLDNNFILYFLITDAPCAYIQFYFNKNGNPTT